MQKKIFGADPYEYYFSKEDQLWDWTNSGYQGIMGIDPDFPPEECLEFSMSQYIRFNVPLPSCIHEVIKTSAGAVLYYVDTLFPYTLFQGISDVDQTTEWNEYAYEVWDGADKVYEPSPEWLETFVYVPGQSEEVFNYIMSHPGLAALPKGIGSELEGMIKGISDYSPYPEEPVWQSMNESDILELRSMCVEADMSFNEKKFIAYFELAAWASFAWIVGPPSAHFRSMHHEVMAVAMSYGECILADGNVFAPRHYKKLSRPPKSCYRCGIAGWCVEAVMTSSSVNYLCEHCVSADMPKFSNRTNCGSKMCMFTECPHNPFHGLGTSGINRAWANHGQLGARGKDDVAAIQAIGGK